MRQFAVEVSDIKSGEVLIRQEFHQEKWAELAAQRLYCEFLVDESPARSHLEKGIYQVFPRPIKDGTCVQVVQVP